MSLPHENTELRRQALAYVTRLYNELTQENGAPPLGTQNQAVDKILGDPELCRAVAAWPGRKRSTRRPPRRLAPCRATRFTIGCAGASKNSSGARRGHPAKRAAKHVRFCRAPGL